MHERDPVNSYSTTANSCKCRTNPDPPVGPCEDDLPKHNIECMRLVKSCSKYKAVTVLLRVAVVIADTKGEIIANIVIQFCRDNDANQSWRPHQHFVKESSKQNKFPTFCLKFSFGRYPGGSPGWHLYYKLSELVTIFSRPDRGPGNKA